MVTGIWISFFGDFLVQVYPDKALPTLFYYINILVCVLFTRNYSSISTIGGNFFMARTKIPSMGNEDYEVHSILDCKKGKKGVLR
jgi:hypothetical protein